MKIELFVLVPKLLIPSILLLAVTLGLGVVWPTFSFSQTSDPDVMKALTQVQTMLTTPSLRNNEINKSNDGREAARKLESLGGSVEVNEQIYALAAEIFTKLIHDTGGNVDKLKQIVSDAQKNPAAFAATWNSQQKEKLKGIAGQIPLN